MKVFKPKISNSRNVLFLSFLTQKLQFFDLKLVHLYPKDTRTILPMYDSLLVNKTLEKKNYEDFEPNSGSNHLSTRKQQKKLENNTQNLTKHPMALDTNC